MTQKGINVFFVRHGQTYFNLMNRFQGWSDIDLTEKGIADGQAAGKRLSKVHFTAAYASDLPRAYKTAQFILDENEAASPAKATLNRDFREIFFGSAEGLTIKQIAEDFDHDIDTSMVDGAIGYGDTIKKYGFDGLMDLFKKNDPLSLAENADEFNSRLQHGLNMIRQNYEIGDNVLVVTHGSLMRALANKYKSPELASKSLSNGAVSKLTFEAKKDGDVTIGLWNDTEKVW
ncbi:histidine phosphatase family protein [Oenococcus oeni]|uniref:histidine phosphatase family protein n=1 Tax=Oenococcus oeni TaxID=1247 RepID=UPI000277B48D|nr:histidine phosphatase family protein [Oenococcus oeni]EJO04875.1 phosphoglycerate mutase family protein [Oenococcus oeni AWRIB548]EJO08200.1 phosphoglycerate mutase family protein [Oenococcus oeni AWRIB422]KEP86412.1 histidine phosphatase [Oenococcus oeni IOEB_0205]KGH67961.1 histidine phosphatase [Oenococcus oeni IOEB_B16]OIL79888.1 histidine phosphatase [Oenococcus oeni]